MVINGYSDETFQRLFKAGKYEEAVEHADQNVPASNRDADIWSKIGTAHEHLNTIEKALACYLVAMRTDSKSYDAHLGAARVYNKLNQPDNAMSMAQKAMELRMTGEASWEYARACIAQNKPAEAKKALEKVVETDPNNIVANRELGQLYYDEKNYSKALPLMKLAYSKGPDSEVAFRIANACKETKQIDQAIEFYEKAANDKTSPKMEAVLELARLYYEKKDFNRAAANYEKAKKSSLTGDDFFAWAVSLEQGKKDIKAAVEVYEDAIKKFGSSTSAEALTAREKAGRYHLQNKNYKQANTVLLPLYKADSEGKKVSDILFLMAQVSEGLNNSSDAITYLEKAIAKDKDNVEAYARLADLYTRAGNKQKAKVTYDRLVNLDPNNPEIHLTLGQYNLKAKKYDEALRNFQRSFTLKATSESAVGMMNSAWKLKKFDMAMDAAESALHHSPGLKEPQMILAKINMQQKNYNAARGVLLVLLKTESKNLDLWKDLAECSEQLNDIKGLVEADKKIIELDPKNVESRIRFAQHSFKVGDLNTAYKINKELAKLQPKNSEIHKSLYETALKQKKTSAAVAHLKDYLALKPDNAAAHRDLGHHLYAAKDTKGALDAYRAAIKADPKIKGLYENYATILLKDKTTDKVLLPVLKAAVSANEANEEIFTAAAEIYQKQKAYSQAIEMYKKALEKNSKNFDNLSSLAYCQEKAGKISDAILSYEQATVMNPNSVKEQKALGDLYVKQKKMPAAVAAYKKYLAKTPTDVKTARFVGDFEYEKKNYPEAIKYYSLVSGKEASNPDYLKNFGTACYNAKNFNKAAELFKQLVAVSPKDPEPLKLLFEIEHRKKNLAGCATYLKKYVALVPSDAKMQKALGDILFHLKDKDGSLAAYRGAIKADPKIKGFYGKYVALVVKGGSTKEQVSALKGAIAANEADAKMYAKLGELYIAANNCKEAIPLLEKASKMDPKNTGVLASMADCHVKSGNVSEAVVILEQVTALKPSATKEFKVLGDLYLKQKKVAQAVAAYKKYLTKHENNAAAKLVGETAYKKKNYSEAVKYLKMVKGKEANSTELLKMMGHSCFAIKDDIRAIDIHKKLAAKEPRNADYVKVLFILSDRTSAKDDAVTYLRKYVALKPGDAKMQRTLADRLYAAKDKKGALKAYKAVLAADSKAKGFHKRFVELVSESGTTQEKINAMKGAIAAGEADGNILVGLGDIYMELKKPQEAAKYYEQAVKADSRNVSLLSTLAKSQEAAGKVNEAIITYEQYIAMNSKARKEYKILGDLYRKQKKGNQAIRMYKKYLEKVPNDNKVALMVGEQAFKAKAYRDAVKYLSKVQGKEAKKAGFLKMYGTAAYRAKDNARALTVLKDLSEIAPKDADVFKMLEDVCRRTGAHEMGVTYLKKYAALKPNDAEANRRLGDLLYKRKDYDDALAAYRAVVKANSSAKGFYKNYVALVMKSGDNKEKISALTGAIAANEANVDMYAALGTLYKKGKAISKAAQMFEKASKLDPRNPRYISELAECQYKSGKLKEAAITYEQAIALNPKAVRELKILGDIYMKQKKVPQAIGMYKRFLDKSSSDSKVALLVGNHAFEQKKYDQALKYLSMVKGENSTTYFFRLGIAASEVKNLKVAIDALEKFRAAALKSRTIVPDKDIAYKALALAYEKSGEKSKAANMIGNYLSLKGVNDPEAAYKRALLVEDGNPKAAVPIFQSNTKSYPKDYRNFLKLGIYYARKEKNLTNAASYLKRCVSVEDSVSRAWFELGLVYGGLKNDKQMLNAFQKFISIETENADAIAKVGEYLLVHRKMGEDAMMFLEMANSLKENDPKIMTLLAQGYIQTNRSAEGMKLLEKVVRNSRGGKVDIKIRQTLGEAYLEHGRFMEAANELKMVTDVKKDPDILLKFASALSGMGRHSEAMGITNEVLAKQPDNVEAIMQSGRVKMAMRNYQDAMETFKKVSYINSKYAPALYERANIYYFQQRYDLAKSFYEKALKIDSKYAMAELGLAKVAKSQRNNAAYKTHLDRAKALDPNNSEILKELKSR